MVAGFQKATIMRWFSVKLEEIGKASGFRLGLSIVLKVGLSGVNNTEGMAIL